MSWREKLHEHLTEEHNDHDEYMKMAEEAEQDGCCVEAGVLRDIAREELTHRKLLGEMLSGNVVKE